MNTTLTDKIVIVLGALFGSYVCYGLIMMNEDRVFLWYLVYAALFAAVAWCACGLWQMKRSAYFVGLTLAAAGLIFGFYLAHFAWTFWIFKEPSFFDRVLAVLHPRIFVFLLVPALWLNYFTRPRIKIRFGL